MRLSFFRMTNNKAIYRSSGKKVIEIDFEKGNKGITIIVGPNGSGKSTIMNAMSPYPDSPAMFLDGTGEEYYVYYNNDIRYELTISYKNGSTHRAFFKKSVNGEMVELNANGNVTSYKDLIDTEFQMDPSALSLTHLSMDNKGIVDKTPSERKKYIGTKLDYVQVYNAINSAANKNLYALRHSLDIIGSELSSIGDPQALDIRHANVVQSINDVKSHMDDSRQKMAVAEATCATLDPDGDISTKYQSLMRKFVFEKSALGSVNLLIPKRYINVGSRYLTEEIDMLKSSSSSLEAEVKTNEYIVNSMVDEQNDIAIKVQDINDRIFVIKNSPRPVNMEKDIEVLKSDISRAEEFFERTGLDKNNIPTKDEYDTAVSIILELKESIFGLRSFLTSDMLSKAIEHYRNKTTVESTLMHISNKIEELKAYKTELRSEIIRYTALLEATSLLEKRPTGCNIDTCPFIKKAVDAFKMEPQQKLDMLHRELDCNDEAIKSLSADLEVTRDIDKAIRSIAALMDQIHRSKNIMSKLPTVFNKSDDEILARINSSYDFSEEEMLSRNLMDAINSLIRYSNAKAKLPELLMKQLEYEKSLNTNELADLMNRKIELEDQYNEITSKLSTERGNLLEKTRQLDDVVSEIGRLMTIRMNLEKKESHETAIKEISEEMDKLQAKVDKINEATKEAEKIRAEFEEYDRKLVPLNRELDEIKVAKAQYAKYKERKDDLDAKYTKTSLIVNSTAISREGIQKLYIDTYFGAIIDITNNILSKLFEGRLRLGKLDNSGRDFKIPCYSLESSVINDDISSCSSAEKTMISMLLSVAIMIRSSQMYNILKLDEIDAQLDYRNRSQFISVLKTVIKYLGVESCFLISHNSEIEIEEANVILLSDGTDPDYPITPSTIFHF